MSDEINMSISIPCDEDGFVLLKCPSCSEEFLLRASDIEDEATTEIWCPSCGLKHDNYFSDEIIELARKKMENCLVDMLNKFSDDMEKMFRNNKVISYKSGSKIKKEAEFELGRPLGEFILSYSPCCDKEIKITETKKFLGGYCPFCGEMIDGN